MKKNILLIFLALVFSSIAFAQHDHHKPEPTPTPSPTPHDHTKKTDVDHKNMPGMDHTSEAKNTHMMSSTVNIGDPMARESSGTSWAPDSSPMYAKMKHYKDGGILMLMGSAFVRYTSIGSKRDV